MKIYLVITCACWRVICLGQNNFQHLPNSSKNTSFIKFTENKNQWHPSVLYRADLQNGFVILQKEAIVINIQDGKVADSRHNHAHKSPHLITNLNQYISFSSSNTSFHNYQIKILGASKKAWLSTHIPTKDKQFFYLGSDPRRWAQEVNSYQEVHYNDIYKHIDYHLLGTQQGLKYEFHVKRGGNPSKIKLKYNYTNGLSLQQNGDLLVKTSVGDVIETKPYSYQIIGSKKVEVASRFVVKGDEVSFEFPEGYHKDYELVIDPELVFCTYSGGSSDNWGNTATFDETGRLYSGGIVFGRDFPRDSISFGPGSTSSFFTATDIAIYRYNPLGTVLETLIFIGGNGPEVPHSLIVDQQNNLCIFGTTGSNNFPVTPPGKPFQGGNGISILGNDYFLGSDIFVMKISPQGNLLASKLLGGAGNDGIKLFSETSDANNTFIHNYGDELRGDIFVDKNNQVYIASSTYSSTLTHATGSSLIPVASYGGSQDGLIYKLDQNLNIIWATYLGGNGIDLALSIKVDTLGRIFVGGGTTSTDLPVSMGAIRGVAPASSDEGFIARLDSNGVIERLTYLGTDKADMVFFIDLDAQGEVYALGQTFGDYPVSPGVYNNPNSGQFIHKMGPELSISQSRWSTVFGSGDGEPDMSLTAFLVADANDCGNIYVSGWGGITNSTYSANHFSSSVLGMPITSGRNTNGSDFYLAMFSKNMQSLLFGEFFGDPNDGIDVSDHVDGGTSRFSENGIIYQTICASCRGTQGLPVTEGAWSSTNNSPNCNNAVFKFAFDLEASFQIENPQADFEIVPSGSKICESTFLFRFAAAEEETFLWEIKDTLGQVIFQQNTDKDFTYTFSEDGFYVIELTAFNPRSCLNKRTARQTLNISIPPIVVNDSVSICQGSSIQLQAEKVEEVRWTPSTGLSDPASFTPIASPKESIVYNVNLKNKFCSLNKKVKVEVLPFSNIDFTPELIQGCAQPYGIRLSIVGELLPLNDSIRAYTAQWDMGDGTILNGFVPPIYTYLSSDKKEYEITLILTYPKGCKQIIRKKINLPEAPVVPPNIVTPNGDGMNDSFRISEAEQKVEIFNRWGKKVFISENYLGDWGKNIESGIYYYVLTNKQGITCNGWIQIAK